MYISSGWTVKNSTFCPQTPFMCIIRIKEQIIIIFLYSKWFLLPRQSVYCDIQNESLNIIQVKFKDHGMTQALSCQPLTVEAWFDPAWVHMRCDMDKLALGKQVSLPACWFPLSVSFLHCFILIFILKLRLPGQQTGNAWDSSKSNAQWELEEH